MPRSARQRLRPGGPVVLVIAASLVLAACGTSNQAASAGPATVSPSAPAAAPPTTTQESMTGPAATVAPSSDPPPDPASDTSADTSAGPSSAPSVHSSAPAETGQASPTPAKAPITNAVTITTPGMRYDVSGALHPGMATITLTNTDDAAHMMGIARLKNGVTISQVTAALAKSEEAAGKLLADSPDTSYGTPSTVGAGQSTTVTATDLPAGHYVLICFLSGKGGMPHWQMGMIDELTVAGEKATEKPASDGTIVIDDKGVTLPDGFTGTGTFQVVNKGKAPHGFSLARLEDGTSLADFAGHVGMAENSGQPVDGGGGVLAGGVDMLAPGQSAFLTLALPPGHYGYISPQDMTGPTLPAQHGEFDVD